MLLARLVLFLPIAHLGNDGTRLSNEDVDDLCCDHDRKDASGGLLLPGSALGDKLAYGQSSICGWWLPL